MDIKRKKKTEMLGIRCYPEDKAWFIEMCKELDCTHAELMSALIGGFEEKRNG